jgi:hypothetical protein
MISAFTEPRNVSDVHSLLASEGGKIAFLSNGFLAPGNCNSRRKTVNWPHSGLC